MSAMLARRSSALARAVFAYPAMAPTLSASRRVMTTAPIDLARRRFEVGVGSTLRVCAPDGWPPRWPVDVDVVVGEEYEAITVEGSWKPAESWEGARPAPPALDARATSDGGVIVTLTPTEADASGLSDAQADMQPRGRGSLRCLVPPRFCGVDVTTGGGHCHVAQVVESAVAVESSGGDVAFGSIRGANLRVNTAGGDVRADTITADAVIGTDGGSVRVGKLVGRTLEVNTMGGDFVVGALFGGVLRVDTAGGAVRVDKQTQVSDTGVVRSAAARFRSGDVLAMQFLVTGEEKKLSPMFERYGVHSILDTPKLVILDQRIPLDNKDALTRLKPYPESEITLDGVVRHLRSLGLREDGEGSTQAGKDEL